MEKKKDRRGGARPGAGRPKGDSKLYAFRCPGAMAALIDAQPNKTEFIRNSITSALLAKESAFSRLGEVIPSYLIRVNGDSMIDAGILSGDIVIIDKSNRNPSPKEIAVCELNGEFTLKHFVKEGSQGWLVPANPDYPKLPITHNDDFSIWGTVTYIIHKAKD